MQEWPWNNNVLVWFQTEAGDFVHGTFLDLLKRFVPRLQTKLTTVQQIARMAKAIHPEMQYAGFPKTRDDSSESTDTRPLSTLTIQQAALPKHRMEAALPPLPVQALHLWFKFATHSFSMSYTDFARLHSLVNISSSNDTIRLVVDLASLLNAIKKSDTYLEALGKKRTRHQCLGTFLFHRTC